MIFSGHLASIDLRDGSNLHRFHLVADDGRRWVLELDEPQTGLSLALRAEFIDGGLGSSPVVGVRISSAS